MTIKLSIQRIQGDNIDPNRFYTGPVISVAVCHTCVQFPQLPPLPETVIILATYNQAQYHKHAAAFGWYVCCWYQQFFDNLPYYGIIWYTHYSWHKL